jgi:hypothetical protein
LKFESVIVLLVASAAAAVALPQQSWPPVAATPPGSTGTARTEVVEETAIPTTEPAPEKTGKPQSPEDCRATFPRENESVPASGGKIALHIEFTPPSCGATPQPLVRWIHPVHNASGEGGVYVWIVDPNPYDVPRRGVIELGANRVVVMQDALRKANYAAAPGRLEFAFKEKKQPEPRYVTVWTDDADVTYTIASSGQSWLVVTPETRDQATRRQRIKIEIQPETLARGRYEATIRIVADGVTARPLAIPVVVEVQPQR